MISMIFPTIRMCAVQFSISGMIYIANERHQIKMHFIIFGLSRYTIVMLMLSYWYVVFMQTIYLIIKQDKCTK